MEYESMGLCLAKDHHREGPGSSGTEDWREATSEGRRESGNCLSCGSCSCGEGGSSRAHAGYIDRQPVRSGRGCRVGRGGVGGHERGAVLMYVFTVEGGARELRRLWDFEKVEAEAEGGCCCC